VRAARVGLTAGIAGLLLAAGVAGGAAGPAPDKPVRFTYLGTGGWLIQHDGASVLTAPFFSNPGLVEVGVARLVPDSVAIDRFLPPVEDVSAILVGHAHYDHLMDVPYILRKKATEARVYGSRTMVNLLRGDREIAPERLVALEGDAVGTPETAGRWSYTSDGRIRFMALASQHAPHLLGIRLYHGEQAMPRTSLPERAHEWLDGPTLAWLIDILGDGGEVLMRIHYQDSASEPPHGFPPASLLPPDGVRVDVVILCTAGSGEAPGHPAGIVEALAPRLVLMGHWEDFFRPLSAPLRAVPGTDVEAFEAYLERILPTGSARARPAPGETLELDVLRGGPAQRPSFSRP
jgi:hypothetical protein